MKNVVSVALGLCSLLFVFSPSVFAADSLSFRIVDYIPEYFKDLEWTVSGSALLSGSDDDNDRETYPIPFTQLLTNSLTVSRGVADIALGSRLNYRFETLSDFTNFYARANAQYSADDLDRTETTRISGLREVESDEYDWRRGRFDATASFTRGSYFSGDWFGRMSGGGLIALQETPTDDRYSFDSVRIVGGSTTEEQRWQLEIDGESNSRQYQLNLEIAAGFGRIYNGEYASTALYMIEELDDAEVLLREPTLNEMRAVSDTIYQYRVSHNVDDRLSRIAVLSGVVNYLTEVGVVNDLGAAGPFLLQDVLDYFPTVDRDFGWKLEATAGGEYERLTEYFLRDQSQTTDVFTYDNATPNVVDTSRSSFQLRTKNNEELESNRLYLGALARYSRPLNRKWQLDGLAETRWYYHDEQRLDRRSEQFSSVTDESYFDTTDYSNRDGWAYVSLFGGLTYIYSSRTSVRFAASYQFIEFASSSSRVLSPNLFVPFGTTYNDLEVWDFEVLAEYRITIPTTVQLRATYTDRESEVLSFNDLSGLHYDNYTITTAIVHYLY